MEWLKSAWARWKVQVSVVGGVLMIATAYGKCSVEPATVSDATTETTITDETTGTVEVSTTTDETTGTTTTETTTTPTTTTTGE